MSSIRCVWITLLGLLLLLNGCGPERAAKFDYRGNQAQAELVALPTPDGVDPRLFAELKQSLSDALAASGKSALAAQPPSSNASQVKDLRIWSDGASALCLFTYANQGDYNQDSQVHLGDLTPLGMNFNLGRTDARWPLAQVADGNGDGLIGLSDVTPIGQYFLVALDGYVLEESVATDGPWAEMAQLPFSGSTVPLAGGPRQFAVPVGGLTTGRYYRVVPVLGPAKGIASAPWLLTADPRPSFTVSGQVLYAGGAPLVGASMTLGNLTPTATDNGGQYQFPAVQDGESAVLIPAATGAYFLPRERYVLVNSAQATGLDFTAFAAASSECVVPVTAGAGAEITLQIHAVDNAHTPLTGFNVLADLSSAPGGMMVVTPPLFMDGTAQAKVRFDAPGDYSISLAGLGPPLDGTLGSVHVTAPPPPDLSVTKWRGNATAAISMTFDDGTADHWSRGIPLWREYGFRVTLGILASRFIDQPQRLPELQEAFNAGHELANHTTTHADLATLTAAQVHDELSTCENLLKSNVMGLSRIDTVIYPYENFSEGVISILRERSYLFARSGSQDMIVYTALNDASDPACHNLYSWANINTMSLESWNVTTDAVVASGDWLIEQCHGIGTQGETGVGWSPRPESEYRDHYDHVRSFGSQVWVAPVNEVGRYLLERNQAEFQIAANYSSHLAFILNTAWDAGGHPVPLTVRFTLPAGWHNVTITQAGSNIIYNAISENQIFFDVIPSNTEIAIDNGS